MIDSLTVKDESVICRLKAFQYCRATNALKLRLKIALMIHNLDLVFP